MKCSYKNKIKYKKVSVSNASSKMLRLSCLMKEPTVCCLNLKLKDGKRYTTQTQTKNRNSNINIQRVWINNKEHYQWYRGMLDNDKMDCISKKTM